MYFTIYMTHLLKGYIGAKKIFCYNKETKKERKLQEKIKQEQNKKLLAQSQESIQHRSYIISAIFILCWGVVNSS